MRASTGDGVGVPVGVGVGSAVASSTASAGVLPLAFAMGAGPGVIAAGALAGSASVVASAGATVGVSRLRQPRSEFIGSARACVVQPPETLLAMRLLAAPSTVFTVELPARLSGAAVNGAVRYPW